MKTIRRNSTRIIAEIKKSIVSVVFYDQNGGGLKPTTLDAAMDDLYRFDFSKLYDNGDGKYTVHVHSNLWYYLYTQEFIDAVEVEKARRDATRVQRPAIATPTREQRNAATIARTTSIHDLGKPAIEPAITVTVTRTRMAIGTQIAEACEALGIELGHGWSKGAAHYEVNGKIYTAGELADLVLEGGFAANYNGNEVRVNWDCPLVFARTQERRAGRALAITRELQARMGTATARELEEVAVSLMDMLHGWAIESAPAEKVDYPSGAAEPDVDVRAVRCVRTGEVWRRNGKGWMTGEGDAARWSIWYRMNEIDPMSEGFNIYREA